MKFVVQAEHIMQKYGWENRVSHPYPLCPMTFQDILSNCRDYDRCTNGSKEYLIMLAEGFRKILESWVSLEESPKVMVRNKINGKVTLMPVDDYQLFMSDNAFSDKLELLSM